MIFNRDDLYCYEEDGTRLTSEKQAEDYFNSVLQKEGFGEKVILVHIPYNGCDKLNI